MPSSIVNIKLKFTKLSRLAKFDLLVLEMANCAHKHIVNSDLMTQKLEAFQTGFVQQNPTWRSNAANMSAQQFMFNAVCTGLYFVQLTSLDRGRFTITD